MMSKFIFAFLFWLLLPQLVEAREAVRTIIDIQGFSKSSSMSTYGGGKAFFIKLNKNIERWYLLRVKWPRSKEFFHFHLENPYPDELRVTVAANRRKLSITDGALVEECDLLSRAGRRALWEALKVKKPYAEVCNGRLYLRSSVKGSMSTKEAAVDFTRDHVWGGETVISAIKDTIYKDAELITTEVTLDESGQASNFSLNGPKNADLSRRFLKARSIPGDLAIAAASEDDGTMAIGKWYAADNLDDAYVSLVQPQAIKKKILSSHPLRVLPLDRVESTAVVYLVAFDLSQIEVGYSVGTEHPKLTYSERTSDRLKVQGWPGPDGVSDYEPLASTGRLSPRDAKRVLATFTGGFKRKHSVFRAGGRSTGNGGNHYGFLQNGVLFSTIHAGLATAYADKNGSFGMKTWRKEDNKKLGDLVFARQNGLPLVYKDRRGNSVPGKLVRHNFKGNWSGSKQNTIRALRSGICLQTNESGTKFLIFGYFSSHTPNGMARVFQSYDCDYAIHLDMNMVVHTYLAVYHTKIGKPIQVEHLLEKMHWKDRKFNDQSIPRFVAVPDNRDFFYLLRQPKKSSRAQAKKDMIDAGSPESVAASRSSKVSR